MFTHISEWHFIIAVRALLIALSMFSTASHGQGEKNGAPLSTPSSTQTGSNPTSIEQTLVPESVFAMQLAEALKLGPVTNEAKAEELLSGLGIEPKNGWISEYPVTPEVLGDVEKGIAMASDQGKIALTKNQALKVFDDVKAKFGFDVKPSSNPPKGLIKKPGKTTVYMYTDNNGRAHFTDDQDSIPVANRKTMKIISQAKLNQPSGGVGGGTTQAPAPQYKAKPNPEVINQQYEEQGPPVVTYYAPPDTYSYLYSWVPYPFWSTGLYYPGYFVLKDFHRQATVNRHPYFVTHHHGGGSEFSRSRSVERENRGLQGQFAPEGMDHSRGFSTPNAQAGAREIVKHNQKRNDLTNGTLDSRMDTSRKPFLSEGNSGAFGNTPVVPGGRIVMPNDLNRSTPYSGGRIMDQPSFNQRSYVPNNPRFNSPPAFSQDRARSFGGNDSGGFQSGGSFGGFQGGGNFTGHGGGAGSAGGASRGGHR